MHDPAAGWSELHHGLDPRANRLLWSWLRTVWRLARPLAQLRVPPLAITALGAALALGAAITGSAWLALILVAAAVLCDGLDGAVAVLRGVASPRGATADKAADRIADVSFVVVIWRCGAPGWLALVAGIAMLAVEASREIRGGRLRSTITVAERPSRAVCVALACICSTVSTATWPAAVCASVLLGLSVMALAQLAAVGRAS